MTNGEINKLLPITRDSVEEYRIEKFLKNPEVIRIMELVNNDDSMDKPKGTWHHKPIIISPADDLYE